MDADRMHDQCLYSPCEMQDVFYIHPDLRGDWELLRGVVTEFHSLNDPVDILRHPHYNHIARLLRRAKINGERVWQDGDLVSSTVVLMAMEHLIDINQHHIRQSRQKRLSLISAR